MLSPNKYKMHTQRDGSVGKWDRNLYLKDPPKKLAGHDSSPVILEYGGQWVPEKLAD